jgi:hypothetical protein
VSIKQNNKIQIRGRTIHVDFIIIADWLSLAGVFGEMWCYYCPCTNLNYFEELDSVTEQRWKLTDPDVVIEDSLLAIPRKNIFLCMFHSSKRIVEVLLNRGLQLWTTLEEDTELKKKRKWYRLLDFQCWLTKLEIPFRVNGVTGSVKEIKLDGVHVRQLMDNNEWRNGVCYLDASPDWLAIWEVIRREMPDNSCSHLQFYIHWINQQPFLQLHSAINMRSKHKHWRIYGETN